MEEVLVSCPYCGGSFTIPKGSATAQCPYCGTQIMFTTLDLSGMPALMTPLRVSEHEARKYLIKEVAKYTVLDPSYTNELSRAESKVVFIPYAVFHIEGTATTSYRGGKEDVASKVSDMLVQTITSQIGIGVPETEAGRVYKGTVSIVREVAVPLVREFIPLAGEGIPPNARTYTDGTLLERSVPLQPNLPVPPVGNPIDISEKPKGLIDLKELAEALRGDTTVFSSAVDYVKTLAKYELLKEALERGPVPEEYRIQILPTMNVFVPMYYMTFKRGWALLNGYTGNVEVLVFEETQKTRKMAMMAGGAAAVIGLVAGLINGTLLPSLGVGIISLVSALFLNRKDMKVRGRVMSGEKKIKEEAVEEMREFIERAAGG